MKKEHDYKQKLISTDELIKQIKPGNRIFLSSGFAWPAFTIKSILNANYIRSYDLEFIQLLIYISIFTPPMLT